MKVFIRLILITVVAVSAVLAWKIPPLARVGTGYMAKNICSERHVAGRNDLSAIRDDLISVDPLFAHIELESGESEAGRSPYIRATIPMGLFQSTAVYRENLGCTLSVGVDIQDLTELDESVADRLEVFRPSPLPRSNRGWPGLEKALDAAFREPSDSSQRNTRAIIVLHKGEIVAERYAEGFSETSPMIGWSMSKSITNNLVGLLVKDGLLDLDAPAPVSAWSDPSDVRHGISLRNLLQMSSGLDFEEIYDPGTDATRMLFTEYSAGLFAAESGLVSPPGTVWSYSSGTSNILSRIVFEKTGGTIESMYLFMHERLFAPLGLTSLVMEPDAAGAPVGSSYTYATARDWARLGQFWLKGVTPEGERILPEGWMNWSCEPAPASTRGEYGAQFWLNAGRDGEPPYWPDLPTNICFANGFNGQSVVLIPDQEIVVVRLGLTTDNSFSLGELLRGVLLALTPGD